MKDRTLLQDVFATATLNERLSGQVIEEDIQRNILQNYDSYELLMIPNAKQMRSNLSSLSICWELLSQHTGKYMAQYSQYTTTQK